MKRTELLQRLTKLGCKLVRHGGKHDWYINRETGELQPVPRHNEIDEFLARHILRILGSKEQRERK